MSSSSSAPQPALQPSPPTTAAPPPTTAAPRAERCSTDTAAAPVPPATSPPRQLSVSVPAAPHPPPPPTSAGPHAEHVDEVPSVTTGADSEKGAAEVRAEREADACAAARDGRDVTIATGEVVGSDVDLKRWQSDRGDSVSPDR